MTTIPTWAWIVSLAGVAGMLTGFIATVPRTRRAWAAATLALWVAIAGYLAASGALAQGPTTPVPWIGPTIAVALALALLGLRMAGRLDLAALTLGQTFRVIGGLFVVLMLLGTLPAVFAIPAGLGDVAVGLTAPVIARRLRRGDVRGARTFHVMGIVDLVVALSTGILAAPGPYQVFTGPASTAAMTAIPLALIPTVLVPLSIAVHVTVLRRLSQHAGTAPRPTPAMA
jgi:hypothetical protein